MMILIPDMQISINAGLTTHHCAKPIEVTLNEQTSILLLLRQNQVVIGERIIICTTVTTKAQAVNVRQAAS